MLKCRRNDIEPRVFRQIKNDVHILYRLTGRAFDHVVDSGNDDQGAGAFVHMQRNIAEIAVFNIPQVRDFPVFFDADKRFVLIEFNYQQG